MVPKKGIDELRVFIDLKTVNKVTKPSNLLLPRINDIMREMSGKKYYLSTDISKAFWSCFVPECQRKWYIKCDPLTRDKLAFPRTRRLHADYRMFSKYILIILSGQSIIFYILPSALC